MSDQQIAIAQWLMDRNNTSVPGRTYQPTEDYPILHYPPKTFFLPYEVCMGLSEYLSKYDPRFERKISAIRVLHDWWNNSPVSEDMNLYYAKELISKLFNSGLREK